MANDSEERPSLSSRIAASPRPAAAWSIVMLTLITVEFSAFASGVLTLLDVVVMGATALLDVILGSFAPRLEQTVVDFQQTASTSINGLRNSVREVPTLLSREVIPNQGYKTGPNGPWRNTFLGLQPALAWGFRVGLVAVYSMFTYYWIFKGWMTFRDNYRYAGWTPQDDILNRLRGHRWGQFGIIVLLLFLTVGLFAPTLGPTTVEQNIYSSYSYDINYYSQETGQVETVSAGDANFQTKSIGSSSNVAPMTYDMFGRFHPFGTLPTGRDLFTFMMAGARISLIVAGLAISISSFIAAVMSLLSAYYTGWVDLTTLTIADGIVSIPQLLLLILVSVAFRNHWLTQILDSGLLLAIVFGLSGWPFLWRSVRGPALQVAEKTWIDAAKSFGQQPSKTMRKHMFPYVVGYLLVYASMSVGSTVIGLASLSFLGNGLGINPPTPAWGRAISLGQDYVATQSWHISLIPGIMIVLLVTGCNAFGDGIRDAIDPESEGGSEEEADAGNAAG